MPPLENSGGAFNTSNRFMLNTIDSKNTCICTLAHPRYFARWVILETVPSNGARILLNQRSLSLFLWIMLFFMIAPLWQRRLFISFCAFLQQYCLSPKTIPPPGQMCFNPSWSFISQNRRGQPLVSLAVIVSLIAGTRTSGGLKVRCELDQGRYPKGQKITDTQMASINIEPGKFHGDWNYTIHPRNGRSI